jgi:hypothetical protein
VELELVESLGGAVGIIGRMRRRRCLLSVLAVVGEEPPRHRRSERGDVHDDLRGRGGRGRLESWRPLPSRHCGRRGRAVRDADGRGGTYIPGRRGRRGGRGGGAPGERGAAATRPPPPTMRGRRAAPWTDGRAEECSRVPLAAVILLGS